MAGTGVFQFESIDEGLPLLPLAARRALDAAGRKLSLGAWKGLPLEIRRSLVELGRADEVDCRLVLDAIATAEPSAAEVSASLERQLDEPPESLRERLAEAWPRLGRLERFALRHVASRGRTARLTVAIAEIVSAPLLSHLDARGDARMVDVGDKPVSHRRALASAVVKMHPETAQLIVSSSGPKGDVLAAARVAGIMAAKRTPDIIPLCHGIALTRVALDFDVDVPRGEVTIKAAADARDRTGVEMEAMVAASVAALVIYDMLKAVERGIRVERVVLLEKSGGRSGWYRRDPEEEP